MPNINDMLKDARKDLKDYTNGVQLVDSAIDQATKDLGEYGKAKALLGAAVRSMLGISRQLEDNVKGLNKSFSDFKKNKALVVAQADKNDYAKIEDGYTDAIRDCMKGCRQIDDMLKKLEPLI
ncbi:MAG TPA: hypothetical protein VMU33_03070 [Burkholderiaceae bacterium]|nr:hypothetical protein [Burkholderiaceae bacterium]